MSRNLEQTPPPDRTTPCHINIRVMTGENRETLGEKSRSARPPSSQRAIPLVLIRMMFAHESAHSRIERTAKRKNMFALSASDDL